MEKFPMTAERHAMLENELMHRQQVERPRIIQQIADARTDDSDLSENAEYQAAKELQEANESRIAELEDKLARAEVIDITKLSGDTVKFGATVTLIDEETDEKHVWKIVGEPEADAKSGTISITSPLGPRTDRQRKKRERRSRGPRGHQGLQDPKDRVAMTFGNAHLADYRPKQGPVWTLMRC
jgi:transcription elongation factor GreA